LILGVGKAYAAIFDTDLLPGSDNNANVGQNSRRWRDANFSGTVSVDGSLNTGSAVIGGGTITNALHHGSISVNPPAIGGNSNATFSVTAPVRIDASDRVFLTPNKNLEAGLVLVGAKTDSANNKIEITLRNTTGSSINGAALDWYYLLIK
jgi:hypothetical protein